MSENAVDRFVVDLDRRGLVLEMESKTFKASIEAFEGEEEKMGREFRYHWVAFNEGEFVGASLSLWGLARGLDRKGISQTNVFIRRIDPRPRTLILETT